MTVFMYGNFINFYIINNEGSIIIKVFDLYKIKNISMDIIDELVNSNDRDNYLILYSMIKANYNENMD